MRAIAVLVALIVLAVIVVSAGRAVDRYYDHQEFLARSPSWQMTMESRQLSAERERGGNGLFWLLAGMAAVAVGTLILVHGAPFLQNAARLLSEARRWRRPGQARRTHPGSQVPMVQVMRPWEPRQEHEGDQRLLSPGYGDEGEERPFVARNARLERFRLHD